MQRLLPGLAKFVTQRSAIGSTSVLLAKRYSSDYTESDVWITKMKVRFFQLDSDKNEIVDDKDLFALAKSFAEYNKKGPEVEQEYFKVVKSVYGHAVSDGVNEEQFLEGMKKFVGRPEAKERVKKFAEMIFEIMDKDNDGVISFQETVDFGRNVLKMEDKLIQLFFENTDLDKDGVISPEENLAIVEKFFFTDQMVRKI